MPIRKLVLILVAVIYMAMCTGSPAWAQPSVVGRAAVLIDSDSGRILYAKNANESMLPASTTKIVTAIIALEKTQLTDIVTAGKNATVVEPSAIGLKEGEKMNMENLLYSLMLKSANDAAIAIAEHISGSVGSFADLMNSSARAWGATNSNFVNPNGLPDANHYTTAHDLAVITRHAMENPVFRQIVSTKVKTIPRADDSAIKWLQNHNKMLWRYDGADGVKTGYTKEAKQCLVVSAEKNGQGMIAVILGSEGSNIWSDAKVLMDYGFNNFETYKHKEANVTVTSLPVNKGTANVSLVTQKPFFYTWPKGGRGQVTETPVISQDITAPIKKGQVLGSLKFVSQGKEIGSVSLIAGNDIAVKSLSLAGGSKSTTPWLFAGLALGLFFALIIRRRRRRRKRVWRFRNIR